MDVFDNNLIIKPLSDGRNKVTLFQNFILNLDDSGILYERTVYDIMSVIGDWGGVVQVIEVVGGILVSSWASFNYTLKSIKVLYNVRTKDKYLFLKPKSDKAKKKI